LPASGGPGHSMSLASISAPLNILSIPSLCAYFCMAAMSSSVIHFVTENLSSSFESFSFDAFRAWAGESSAKTLSPRGFEDSDVLANASFAPSSLSSTGEANPFSVSLPFFSREKATTRLPFRPSREDKKLETFDVLVQVQEDAQDERRILNLSSTNLGIRRF